METFKNNQNVRTSSERTITISYEIYKKLYIHVFVINSNATISIQIFLMENRIYEKKRQKERKRRDLGSYKHCDDNRYKLY